MEIFIGGYWNSKSPARAYALAVAAALAALLVRGLLTPLLGGETPYLAAWAAVVFSAWYCGLGPSIVTVLVSLLGVLYFFLPPTHTFRLMSPKSQLTGMVGFLVFSAFIVGLGELNRRSQTKLEREVADRLEGERQLREASRELHETQRLARIGSWKWDPQTDVVTWSAGLYRILGRDSTVRPPSFAEIKILYPPESWERLRTAVERTLATGEGYDLKLDMIRADGAVIHVVTHAEAQRDDAGRVVKLYGSLQDITENERSEATLRESEERLHFIADRAQIGLWLWDIPTDRLEWSPLCKQLFGIPVDEVMSYARFLLAVHPADREQVDLINRKYLSSGGGSDYNHEYRVVLPDGAIRWIHARGSANFQNGLPVRMAGVVLDVTGHRQAEEALRQNEERLRMAHRAAHSGAWEVNMKTKEIFWSPEMQALWGLVPGTITDIRGQIRRMVVEQDHSVVDQALEDALAGRGYHLEFRIVRPDNEQRWMESFGEMVYDDGGAPSRIVGVAIDVTEKKRAEEALRRSHLELENKVRERTQELAKSLSSLEMEVELRRQTENSLRDLSTRLLRLQDEERRRIARDLHDSTGQTLTALKLTLAALERLARSVPDAAALFEQLDGLAEEALRDIRTTSHLLHPPLLDEVGFRSAALWYVEGLAKRSGIEVKVDLDDDGARISKSAELAFFRVLQESLTNVLRHSGSKSVDITLEVEPDMATLTIRDYGKGIPGHTLSSFEETGAGVGVGLGGMKQRIHEFGGRLKISSDGSGTSVSATLPLAATSQLNPENGKALDPQTDEIPGTDGQIAPQPE